ncbi:hypothetical protein AB833_15560 [Chromatiales bacterium (ex Bugula neritina AB1)]|nr:hypothetical protein AB833_15560 [Chromatiales bacterium (ex Bugula neritina AB1)]
MPAHMKVLLSVIILIVCLSVFYYDHTHDGGIEKWVALFLGPLMVVSIWIFPEANSGSIRKEVSRRRKS